MVRDYVELCSDDPNSVFVLQLTLFCGIGSFTLRMRSPPLEDFLEVTSLMRHLTSLKAVFFNMF